MGLAAFGPINPHTAARSDATAAFGEPSAVERAGARCRRRWPDLGLAIEFAAVGGEDPCGSGAGIEAIRVAGSAAVQAGWRTAEGIRPGMRVAGARRIYPEASRSGNELTLVRGPSDGQAATVLAVETAASRVAAMTFPIAERRIR